MGSNDSLTRLRALHAPVALADVEKILGPAEHDIGSGVHIFVYDLDDDTVVRVGTPDRQHVTYIIAVDGRGKHILYQQPS